MITKKTEYAMRALWELQLNPDQLMTAAQIARQQNVPPKYLPQIVSQLARAGLVNSTRGYGGGIRLSADPKEITMLDVIVAIQGNPVLFECQLDGNGCNSENNCGLLGVYNKALNSMLTVFENTRLIDINLKVRK